MGERIAYGLLLGLLCYISLFLAAGAEADGRGVLVRYWCLLAAGAFAVGAPHVLLPDAHLHLVQLVNLSPRALLAHQLRPWGFAMLLFALPVVLLALYDPAAPAEGLEEKGLLALTGLLIVLGAGLYAFERYVTIGEVSQAWQEGRAGYLYRSMSEHATVPVGLPPGLVPALTATARIFIVSALAVAAGALVGRAEPALVWVPGGVLLAWAAFRIGRRLSAYDRHFYHTNAFYAEIFRGAGGVRSAQREPVPYHAVYWVPLPWKAHVWASLRQLDRRLPLGRFIAMGHLFLWVLFYQETTGGLIAAYLLLFSVAKNGFVYLLATEPFAPEPFQVIQQAPAGWVATRFFVNLRWSLPFLLSLLLVAVFDDRWDYINVLAWTGLDLWLAFLTAWFVTFIAEARYKKRYA